MLDYDLARQRLQAKGKQYKAHPGICGRITDLLIKIKAHELAPPALQGAIETALRREAAELDEMVANLGTPR
jgi:hypothetical protein